MSENPITNPMVTVLDQSVQAAVWLQGTTQYSAGIALARSIASQIDSLLAGSGGVPDPEVIKQLHMRVIPNYQRALFTLGLTPEGYAKMTGAGSYGTPKDSPSDQAPDTPPGIPTPFSAAASATGDALDALISAETARTNVIQLGDRR